MLAKKHKTLMISRFFVIEGIVFIIIRQKLSFLHAKVQKIDVEIGRKHPYICFFHEL